MSSTAASGGVRNLRAMFENKAGDTISTSPPSRERSPVDPDVSAHSRPMSKVRASFVAVETPSEAGQQGQQRRIRKASDVSSMDAKENGNGVGGTADSARKESTAHIRHISKNSLEGGLGTILKGSAFEPSTPRKGATEEVLEKEPEINGVSSDQSKSGAILGSTSAQGGDDRMASMVDKMNAASDSGKPLPPVTTKLIATKDARPIKLPPTRQVQSKPSIKSPVLPKAPKTPTTSSSATITSPRPKKSPTSISAKTPASRPLKAHEAKLSLPTMKKEEKDTKVNGEKSSQNSPRLATTPRSPSKAVRQPEPAPARKTAAPAAKIQTTHQPNGTKSNKSPTESKTSSLRHPPRAIATGSTTTTASLSKKTSRASLPAQTSAHDSSKSRVSTASKTPDESFLARMMRPTASTASKAHEKVQVSSPPRGNRNVAATARKSLGHAKTEDKENDGQGVSPVEKTNAVV